MNFRLLSLLATVVACTPTITGEGEEGEADGEGEGNQQSEGEGEAGEGEGEGEDAAEGEGEGEPTVSVLSSLPSGTFTDAVTITLTPSVPGLSLWLTTDGSVPAAGVSSPQTTITITTSTIMRAIAVDIEGAVQASFTGLWLQLNDDMEAFSTSLPVVVLWSQLPAPEEKADEYTTAAMLVVEPTNGITLWPGAASLASRAGIKIRGSSSAGYSKHPWRVETWSAVDDDDDDLTLLGMPADSDWVFNAPADFDRALMRNSVAFAMSNAIGRYAPRTRFAEVFVVGDGQSVSLADYVGVYEATERIKRGADRVNITRLRATDSGTAISGGYLFKEDRTGPDDEPLYVEGGLSFQQSFVVEDPANLEDPQREYLTSYLDGIASALTSPSFIDPQSGLRYDELLDVGSFIDHHIINLLTKNPDGFRLSGYFHKDRDGPLQAGPVWDFDRTMGCASDDRAADPVWWDTTNQTSDTTFYFDHGFYGGLFDDSTFRAAYWQRLEDVLTGPLTIVALHGIIDDNAAQLASAATRNFERYPEFSPRGSFDDELNLLKDWLRQRHDWISACLTLPDPLLCTGE